MTTCRRSLHPEKGGKGGRLQDCSLRSLRSHGTRRCAGQGTRRADPGPGDVCCREGPLAQQMARARAQDGLDRMGRGGGSRWGLCTQAEAWPFYLRGCAEGGRELPGSLLLPQGHLRGHPRAVTSPGRPPAQLPQEDRLSAHSFRTTRPAGEPGMGSLILSLTLQGPKDNGEQARENPHEGGTR